MYVYIYMIDVTPRHPSLSFFCSVYFPMDLGFADPEPPKKHIPHRLRVSKKVTLGTGDPGSCGRNQETIVYFYSVFI